MPTYEYACTKCGQHVEVFQRLSEPALTECGVCGGPLRKVFHPVGIVFKGSGFYATDSRSKPKTDSGSADGGKDGVKKETPSTSSGSSSKSDAGAPSTPSSTSGEKAS